LEENGRRRRGLGKRVGEKGQNELLERGAMGFSIGEEGRVKG
jgi:hypothetical protein